MKISAGAFLPDDEMDEVILSNGTQYQGDKLRTALKYVKKARTAIDIGAHCGLWTSQLAQYFERVEAFEPLPRHHECWERNAGWKKTNVLHKVCLGEEIGSCGIHLVEGLSGRSHIIEGNEFEVRRLDDYDFQDVDLIKVDVEGYELKALKGAERTIVKWRPVVIVEQKFNMGKRYGVSDKAALDYLKSMGVRFVDEFVGDYIVSF